MLCNVAEHTVIVAEIKDVTEDLISMCGATLTHEFYFKSIDQAVINAKINHSNIKPCLKCVNRIINYLTREDKIETQNKASGE